MTPRTTGRVGLAVAALFTCAAVAGLAMAAESSPDAASPEQAALERFCANEHPCVVVNGAADPAATGDDADLVRLGESLAASGKPPSACPKAHAAYAAAGIDADAFVGPCPSAPPRAAGKIADEARANDARALTSRGGSR
jgi:hypothetical protein